MTASNDKNSTNSTLNELLRSRITFKIRHKKYGKQYISIRSRNLIRVKAKSLGT